ncbi:MAG: hypothetical protein WAM11_00670 [Cyanobium sp.]
MSRPAPLASFSGAGAGGGGSAAGLQAVAQQAPALQAPSLQPRSTAKRQGISHSHDWLDITVTVPAAGGSIALIGEDAHGWDYKVRKTLVHATSLGLTAIPLDPGAPADLLVVSSLFIDSPVLRRLRAAGLAVVASKAEREREPALAVRP